MSSPGAEAERPLRFFENREKYLLFVTAGGEIWGIVSLVCMRTPNDRKGREMKVLILTNEYPPNVYGGAGVHVDHLSRALAKRIRVEVRCFGDPGGLPSNPDVRRYGRPEALVTAGPCEPEPSLDALARNVAMSADPIDADVIHCHTWYSHLGGIVGRLLHGLPLVVTTHSLEPLRPWKREQLGRGYDLSSWVERNALELADAIIAVSQETRDDILRYFRVDPQRVHVVPNGVDTETFRRVDERDELERLGVSHDEPYVLFLGRTTRQKGITHLLRAAANLPDGVGIVLCAGKADSGSLAREVAEDVQALRRAGRSVHWIQQMVSTRAATQLYSHAAVFCCPSIYEPFGIINLEAMACETPVVASRVGGIKEVVADGTTGLLVPFEPAAPPSFEPRHPERFAADLANAIRRLLADAALRRRMGEAGRRHVTASYSWDAVADGAIAVYQGVLADDTGAHRAAPCGPHAPRLSRDGTRPQQGPPT